MMAADDLQCQADQRGERWRAIAAKLDSRHERERETMRIAHACEWSSSYRKFMDTEPAIE